MTHRDSSEDIDDAAAQWATRLDGGPLDVGAQRQLDNWLGGDLRRRGALARAMAILAYVQDAGPA